MIMNVQKLQQATSNSNMYTKNVQTTQNLHNVQTKNGLKLEMYVLCTCKQCTNYTKPIATTSQLK